MGPHLPAARKCPLLGVLMATDDPRFDPIPFPDREPPIVGGEGFDLSKPPAMPKPPGEVHGTVQSLTQTLANPCARRAPLVEGWLYEGEIGTLAARQGSGKTPLITQLGCSIAAGRPFLDLPTHARRVCLIDVESPPDRFQATIRAQCAAMNVELSAIDQSLDLFVLGNPNDPNSVELERIMNAPAPYRWEWVRNLAGERQYGLVSIDTMLTFDPFNSSDEERVRELFASLRRIRNEPPHPTLLGSLHLRKGDRKSPPPRLADDPYVWTQEILGSTIWSASADVRLGLEVHPESDHRIVSGFRRGDGPLDPIVIQTVTTLVDGRRQPTHWRRCRGLELAAVLLTEHEQQYFAALPVDTWLGWSQMAKFTGASRTSMSRFIKHAAAAKLLEVTWDTNPRMYRRTL